MNDDLVIISLIKCTAILWLMLLCITNMNQYILNYWNYIWMVPVYGNSCGNDSSILTYVLSTFSGPISLHEHGICIHFISWAWGFRSRTVFFSSCSSFWLITLLLWILKRIPQKMYYENISISFKQCSAKMHKNSIVKIQMNLLNRKLKSLTFTSDALYWYLFGLSRKALYITFA